MNFWYNLIYELYLIFMSIQVFDVNISLSESEAAHMHTKSKYPWLRHIDFLIVDIVSLLTAFTVAFVLHFKGLWVTDGDGWSSATWLRLVLLFVFADVILTFVLNPYGGIFKRRYYMEFVRAIQLTAFNAISVALVLYIFKIGEDYSRTVYILTYVFYFVLSLIVKFLWKKLVVSGKVSAGNAKNLSLFIITQTDRVDSALVNVAAGDYDPYDIKGLHFADDASAAEYKGIPVVSSDCADYIIKNNISDVLIALPPSRLDRQAYKKLIDNAVNVHIDIESMIGMQTENQFVSDVGIYKTLSVGAFTFRPGQLLYLGVKRLLDIVFGLLGLVLVIPTTIIVKTAYLLTGDRAGIFYTQKRVGQNGKPIRILKYRTMVPDADKKLEELLKDEKYRAEWEANQKFASDPRITKVGKVLRKLSVDELPQMLNILAGSMSLVGPRPLIEGELEAHGGLKLYQKVKPGITGWWACNGRSNIEYRERLELEYYYIKHFSMQLDILCVFRTIAAVIKKDGAG